MLFNANWVSNCCSMSNERMKVVQGQMREWMLFMAKWENESCLVPIKQLSFSHLALHNIHSLIWHYTTFIHSFGITQHSFSHLEWKLLNAKWVNECCLMPIEWVIVVQCQMRKWMLFNAKWEIKQHSFTHLALNNIHSFICHWTTITHSFGIK
jgi:hypothetical protein